MKIPQMLEPLLESATDEQKLEIVIEITGWNGSNTFYSQERRFSGDVLGLPGVKEAIAVIDSAMHAASQAAKVGVVQLPED